MSQQNIIFSGLQKGAKQTLKSLSEKIMLVKKNSESSSSESSEDSPLTKSDVQKQIKMLKEDMEAAKAKELKYKLQDDEAKKIKEEQQAQKQNQHELASEMLLREEEKQKMQRFCKDHGFNLSISKDGSFKITDEKGVELKNLEEKFIDQSKSHQKGFDKGREQ